MYKLLLCLRYLRTRYIALASIVSVTLGVATMVVVNSVMAGFTTEMKDRIRGLLADVVIESHSLQGHPDPEALMARAEAAAPGLIEAATPTVEMYAVMSFDYLGEPISRPVQLIGIDPRGKAKVGPLKHNLASYKPTERDGKIVAPAERSMDEELGWSLTETGRQVALRIDQYEQARLRLAAGGPYDGGAYEEDPFADPAGAVVPADATDYAAEEDPFAAYSTAAPAPPASDGLLDGRVMIGQQLISVPMETADGGIEERLLVHPGQRVTITTVKTPPGRPPEPASMNATVTDVFKSGMSEYDSRVVFCNIERLQEVRGMLTPDPDDPTVREGREVQLLSGPLAGKTGQVLSTDGPFAVVRCGAWYEPGQELRFEKSDLRPLSRSATTIQIKLKPGVDPDVAVAALKAEFPPERFSVGTWRDKQGPLLAAVDMETTILNVLLFLIVAVAGFGILAIFYMIVVEKTRDIGILKALGASGRGILTIFLAYGVSLGLVGAGAGVVLGLVFVRYINEVEQFISYVTGRPVFDERIYYFPEIPTRVDPVTVLWVAAGAVTIAVLASVMPARRAAGLHPVKALRYE